MAALALAPACARIAQAPMATAAPARVEPTCHAELRSWIVAGRGRHLYLQIDCPAPEEARPGRVEFWDTAHRPDFQQPDDPDRQARIARTAEGMRLAPPFVPADNRLEAVYELTAEQAACLRRDRVFARRYFLLGPNSNSAMRAAYDECGVELPRRVMQGAGALGEFPGINMDPGAPIPPQRWEQFGLRFSPQ